MRQSQPTLPVHVDVEHHRRRADDHRRRERDAGGHRSAHLALHRLPAHRIYVQDGRPAERRRRARVGPAERSRSRVAPPSPSAASFPSDAASTSPGTAVPPDIVSDRELIVTLAARTRSGGSTLRLICSGVAFGGVVDGAGVLMPPPPPPQAASSSAAKKGTRTFMAYCNGACRSEQASVPRQSRRIKRTDRPTADVCGTSPWGEPPVLRDIGRR